MRDQLHAEDGLGRGVCVVQRLGDLDAATLAATAGMNLRLDHHDRIARGKELLGRVVGLFQRRHHLAFGDGNAVLPQNFLRLVFVNLHLGNKLERVKSWCNTGMVADCGNERKWIPHIRPFIAHLPDLREDGAMEPLDLLTAVVNGGDTLSADDARALMQALLAGEFSENEMSTLLSALHDRGETSAELAGFSEAMRSAAVKLPLTDAERDTLVDTCGTGGDGSGTFNISTAVALVACAAGARIAKHGNRAVTSRCGSADVLAALGIPVEHTAESATAALRAHGFAFLLATRMHPAIRIVAPVRRALPFRTVFNLLGPMSNPAGARRQVIGVYSAQAVPLVAEALAFSGHMQHAMVVHGAGSLDELSLSGESAVAEVKGTDVIQRVLSPEDAGLARSQDSLQGGGAEENAGILRSIFAGERGPRRDIVLLNAAAVLMVAGLARDLRDGASRAAEAIDSGKVTDLVQRL